MTKSKALFILHYSPPVHGASKVGDLIKKSEKINNSLNIKWIKIKSSDKLSEIGKFNLKKIWYINNLFASVCWSIFSFRPQKIYFTPQPSGIPFFRDLIICFLLKIYKKLSNSNIDLYFHYHSKGAKTFTKKPFNKFLFQKFINDSNLILLDNSQLIDFKELNLKKCKEVHILPNGIKGRLTKPESLQIINSKYHSINRVNIVFLSNMIREKGYFDVLIVVKELINKGYKNFQVNLAGAWVSENDKKEFNKYVQNNNLTDYVKHWGYADEELKHKLFSNAHIILFPTKYQKETFGLVILEAIQYGTIPLTYNTAALPNIVSNEIGIVTKMNNIEELVSSFETIYLNMLNKNTAIKCSKKFFAEYSCEIFENNLLKILN